MFGERNVRLIETARTPYMSGKCYSTLLIEQINPETGDTTQRPLLRMEATNEIVMGAVWEWAVKALERELQAMERPMISGTIHPAVKIAS